MLKLLCLYLIVKHCNSTEYVNQTYIRKPRQLLGNGLNNDSCVLPEHPQYGKWSIYQGTTSELNPGQKVPFSTILRVTCDKNYKLDNTATIVCVTGKWTSEIGPCLRTCPARYDTSLLTVTCVRDKIKLKNCENAVHGTIAQFRCSEFYELDRASAHYCYNGRWSGNLPECIPICGQTTAIGEGNSTRNIFPWHVALYNAVNKRLLCGGSLLNERVVLTAAHCITDSEGKLVSKEDIMVAAGKYHSEYDHPKDAKYAQYSTIYEMYIPTHYKGDIQNYNGDIGILVTNKTFQFSISVQPVCIDSQHDELKLEKNHTGFVTGFDSRYKNSSHILKQRKLRVIPTAQCYRQIPSDYLQFLTKDKLCASSLNSSSICMGESGAGLVTSQENTYYIIGVASLTPQSPVDDGCGGQEISMFTSVNDYVERFISPKEAQFRVSGVSKLQTLKTCTVPEDPNFGRWIIYGNSSSYLLPRSTVVDGTTLEITCDKLYKLEGDSVTICENGTWSKSTGRCLKICPLRLSTATMKVICTYNNKDFENCTDAIDGTLASYRCAPLYESNSLQIKPIHTCRNGEWDEPEPYCTPVCGQKTVEAKPLIINGSEVNKGDYPWQVAIYTVDNKELICSGSLLSQKIILTAAHCVTDATGKKLSERNYIVGVGKYYRTFNDSRDLNEAQFSRIKDMFIPDEYQGVTQNYLGDIAILITKKIFTLSRRVQPVCYDSNQIYNVLYKEYGYVTGWGYTVEHSKPSDVLKDLKVPSVSITACRNNLQEDFEVYLTHDKLCAGYLNKATSVCSGDSGGGLVFKHNDRYFITGIVSVSPTAPTTIGGCDSNQYTLYTNVSFYMKSLVLPKLNKFKP